MKIGKSNILTDMIIGTDFTISNGGVVDGSPNDMFNPDFSFFTTINGVAPEVTIFSTQNPSDYLAIHGVRFNTGIDFPVRLRIYDDTTVIYSEELTTNKSVFITRESSNNVWRIEAFRDDGFPIAIAISYIAAGLHTEFPRNGVRGGEYIPYLGNNRKTTTTSNQLSQPVTRSVQSIAKQVTLSCPNAPLSWVEGDLQFVFNTYNLFGVLSILMFDDKPSSAFAGFDLVDDVRVNGDSAALLGSFKLTMKASL